MEVAAIPPGSGRLFLTDPGVVARASLDPRLLLLRWLRHRGTTALGAVIDFSPRSQIALGSASLAEAELRVDGIPAFWGRTAVARLERD